ncbi:hypothetical protein INS49_000861 [Diaporthe citri]|uniref:uncharacterized protein n=1 Tax=Diaporthe citri TaxID=83186 RepID=UPI001C7E352C|nr:uncharacterized protein INS49_000861 [Diaporthe citri]KAG6366682.1 hypothetical protein INS49_000861 [Diaporthe citri]
MINFPLSNYTADEARLLQTLHPVFKIAAHPERPGNAILADMKTHVKYYKSFVSSFCEPFRTAGLKIEDDGSIPIYPGQQWSPDMPWDSRGGCVTLAGDAAHSMVPQRGQGLNNAMKDAANLADAIRSTPSLKL